MAHRRGIILPIVLVLIGLLALTMAGFIFFVRAENAGTVAFGEGQQARLAAQSGMEEVISILRESPHDASAWFDRPSRFRHALIWARSYDRESDPVRQTGSRAELFRTQNVPEPAWRFSVVADRYQDPAGSETPSMRFGVTPEASKLNLNTATEDQIGELLGPLLFDLEVENPEDLINALLDWRDEDDDTRDGGAESSDYYNTLEPPYQAKNGRFDSIEELLLVKGFNAAVLWGEDVNRNGILDPNEDDGEGSFPYYDNADGILNRGIAPFLTVWSSEPDTALDNKPRINLNLDAASIQAQIAVCFSEDDLAVCQGAINYILQLKGENFNFSQLQSPAELYQGADALAAEEGQGGGALAGSPVTLEELPYLMDRFTTRSTEAAQEALEGLINVNTAPVRVLALIPGLPAEGAAMLVETRAQLSADARRTTAWPMMAEAVDVATFHAIAPYITTKAYQFHVEVLGYADHQQAIQRIEWVIEMAGPLDQVRYYRDLNRLGPAWPIDNEEIAGTGVEMGGTEP
ncbi:MAG: type II secretion system protein GspK [Phycisphaerae bacterium]|jgi:type II secretory pathway component PulK